MAHLASSHVVHPLTPPLRRPVRATKHIWWKDHRNHHLSPSVCRRRSRRRHCCCCCFCCTLWWFVIWRPLDCVLGFLKRPNHLTKAVYSHNRYFSTEASFRDSENKFCHRAARNRKRIEPQIIYKFKKSRLCCKVLGKPHVSVEKRHLWAVVLSAHQLSSRASGERKSGSIFKFFAVTTVKLEPWTSFCAIYANSHLECLAVCGKQKKTFDFFFSCLGSEILQITLARAMCTTKYIVDLSISWAPEVHLACTSQMFVGAERLPTRLEVQSSHAPRLQIRCLGPRIHVAD